MCIRITLQCDSVAFEFIWLLALNYLSLSLSVSQFHSPIAPQHANKAFQKSSNQHTLSHVILKFGPIIDQFLLESIWVLFKSVTFWFNQQRENITSFPSYFCYEVLRMTISHPCFCLIDNDVCSFQLWSESYIFVINGKQMCYSFCANYILCKTYVFSHVW